MIDFELTPEQKEIRRLAHDFAEKEIRPHAAYHDETEEFPWEIVKKAHKLGLTTFSYPEEYGGGGIEDPVASLLVSEELAWGCAGIAVAHQRVASARSRHHGHGNHRTEEKMDPDAV